MRVRCTWNLGACSVRLRGELVEVGQLDQARTHAMFALMDRCYQNVSRERFQADLAEKQWVILLSDPHSAELCGFSTQMLLSMTTEGQSISVLFSGDTIIAPERWGDVSLSHVWGRLALSLIDTYPSVPLYWLLISKGYKTYRFLPLFFHEFYPRYDASTPAWASGVIDAFGRHKFPGSHDPTAGIVRAGGAKDCLRPGVADLTDQRLHDPHVRFFLERNPGYARGDELCCVAPLTRENFTPAAYRVIGAKPATAAAP